MMSPEQIKMFDLEKKLDAFILKRDIETELRIQKERKQYNAAEEAQKERAKKETEEFLASLTEEDVDFILGINSNGNATGLPF